MYNYLNVIKVLQYDRSHVFVSAYLSIPYTTRELRVNVATLLSLGRGYSDVINGNGISNFE